MVRGHPAAYTNAAQAAVARPVWLVTMAGATTFRFTNYHEDVVFPDAGDTFTPKAMNFGTADIDTETPGELTLTIDDEGTTVVDDTDWLDKLVTIARVYRDVTSLATYAQTDVYLVDAAFPPEPGRSAFQLVHRRQRLEMSIPRRLTNLTEFPGLLSRY